MKAIFGLIAAAALVATTGTAWASTSRSGDAKPIAPLMSDLGNAPPASAIVSNAGLEWVWANPCGGTPSGCGGGNAGVMLHHGFGFATDAQWMTWGSLAAFQAAWGGVTCASPQFSLSFDHCDEGDMLAGYIWHSPLTDPAMAANDYSETFLVRAVPEPEGYALMIVGLGLVGLVARRRQQR